MPRITCELPGHDKVWVEFRQDKWTFGDRRTVLEAASDTEWLGVVLPYVTGWNVTDVDGASVEPTVSAVDRVEDDLVGAIGSPKSTLEQIRAHVEFGDPAPPELIEGRVAERFGWTWDELDRQDYPRTVRTIAVVNAVDGYQRVMDATKAHRLDAPSEHDWAMYRLVVGVDDATDG
jgi:hypothetical protein